MDESCTNPDRWVTAPIEQALASLQGRMEEIKLGMAADPDGELSMLDRVLRMKRGCRRG